LEKQNLYIFAWKSRSKQAASIKTKEIIIVAKITLIALLAMGLFQAGDGFADGEHAVPDDNLATPVLMTLKNGLTGSGFYLSTEKFVYIVTAKHVLIDEKTQKPYACALDQKTQKPLECSLELLSYSRDPADTTQNLVKVEMDILQGEGNVKPHPSEDIAVIKLFEKTRIADLPPTSGSAQGPIPQYSLSALHGVTVASNAKLGLTYVPAQVTKTFSQVLIGNDIIVFGYPTSLGLQQLPQLDLQHPLLRKGIVAGKNPKTKSIILDSPAYFGNSGGPVLELDKSAFVTSLYIIGVVNQYVPFVDSAGARTFAITFSSNSGYSIATPMDFVLELVN
jgi:hypothetical protein